MKLRLRELMKERGITQDQLAEDLKLPQSTVSRWVGDKVDRLDKNLMAELCVYLKCEIGDLLVIEHEGTRA